MTEPEQSCAGNHGSHADHDWSCREPLSPHVGADENARAMDVWLRWEEIAEDLWEHENRPVAKNEEGESLEDCLGNAISLEYMPALRAQRLRAETEIRLARKLLAVAHEALDLCQHRITEIGSRTTRESAVAYERERDARMRDRPMVPTVAEHGRKCAKCGKKPARIDDLCKKCARSEGIIVHGKIGDA